MYQHDNDIFMPPFSSSLYCPDSIKRCDISWWIELSKYKLNSFYIFPLEQARRTKILATRYMQCKAHEQKYCKKVVVSDSGNTNLTVTIIYEIQTS